MPGERFREIILRIGDPDLPQIAAERPHHGGVAPAEPGFEHEAVEGVGFRKPAEQRQKRRFDGAGDGVDVDGTAAGPLERHVVQPDAVGFRLPAGAIW